MANKKITMETRLQRIIVRLGEDFKGWSAMAAQASMRGYQSLAFDFDRAAMRKMRARRKLQTWLQEFSR